MNPDAIIVNGGYLVRSASVSDSVLSLQADFNGTTTLEIIGVPKGTSKLVLNGKEVEFTASKLGNWVYKPDVVLPPTNVPELSDLKWYYTDSLPEVQPDYDDSKWPLANLSTTRNSVTPLKTPVSLYSSDYGFHTGTLIYRGRFTAQSADSELQLLTQGGSAYASSVWLNGTFLGSFNGFGSTNNHNSTHKLTGLTMGKNYVLTVVIDTTGINQNFVPGLDLMKEPRGIIDYSLRSSEGNNIDISPWKLTGNLGGEDYQDRFRGPLNEGGLFFERQGYHLPSPPLDAFKPGSPFDGITQAGIVYYTAKLSLDLPADIYDMPLSFTFANSTGSAPYRAMLYVNGFQYGKYVSNIGPQTEFPVPEGILNHHGDNWVGVAVWALENSGAKIPGLGLKVRSPILTSRHQVELVKGPAFSHRDTAY